MPRYNLTPLRGFTGAWQTLLVRYLSMAIVIVCGGLTIYYLAVAGLSGSWNRLTDLRVGGFSALVVVGVWGALTLTPPPASVTVDDVGIKFEDAAGRVWGFKWDLPRFRLLVFRTEGAQDMISQGQPRQAVERVNNLVTPDAVEEVLRQARIHGLDVSIAPGPVGFGTTRAPRNWSRYTLTRSSRAAK